MQANVAVWCVLIAALMPIVCAGIAKWGSMGKSAGAARYDNHDPRTWLARQTGWRQRANHAQANSFEALPFFIGAVVIALQMGADPSRVDALAAAFIACRIVYVALYLADAAALRSLAWVAGLGVNIALLFSA